MVQCEVFLLPKQLKEANAWLAQHNPKEGEVHFNKDMIFVYWEDGVIPLEYEVQSWGEYLIPILRQKQDSEIALAMLERDKSNLDVVKDKSQFEEVLQGIQGIKVAIENRNAKVAFVKEKIAELKVAIKKRDDKATKK